MKTRVSWLWLPVVAFVTFAATQVVSQEEEGKPAGEDARMEAWKRAATPGDEHKRLEALVGTWSTKTKWQMDACAPVEETEGTSEIKSIFGGRFLLEEHESVIQGQPFTGMAIIGFDNVTKRYVTVWVDNHSTGIYSAVGGQDAEGTTITSRGEFSDPESGGRKAVRQVLRIVGDDEFVFEIHDKGPDGKEYKSLEGTYRRQ